MKTSRICLLCALVALALATAGLALPPAGSASASADTFTIMLYLCGSDLETEGAAATLDLIEIVEAELEAKGPVRVIIETGGAKEWYVDTILPSKNQRWLAADGDIILLDQVSRRDMGDPDTLRSFVDYSITNYPADRYALILWDHGAGAAGGVCYDEFTGDALTMAELTLALGGVKRLEKLEFIGFDACLMACVETAAAVSGYARYMIASQELVPGTGWSYTPWLTALRKNPSMPTEDLLVNIIDTFITDSLKEIPGDVVTMSAIDLSRIDEVTAALEDMSVTLAPALDTSFAQLSRGRRDMRSFGAFNGNQSSDMVDLARFAQVYGRLNGVDGDLLSAAVGDAVIYNRHSDNITDIGGLSILMPMDTRDTFYEYNGNYAYASQSPAYAALITGFVDTMNSGSYVFSPGQTQAGYGLFSSLFSGTTAASPIPTPSGGGLFSSLFTEEPPTQAGSSEYFYFIELSADQMSYLSYVEGNLMLDLSDEDSEFYLDLGYLRDVRIDWERGVVSSEFDGTWPMLDYKLVNMMDQIVSPTMRRSLIDVTVNDDEVYLLVQFDEVSPQGEVVGYTRGWDDNGLPVRGYTKLTTGDIIVPMYDVLYWDEDGNQQFDRIDGDPITYNGTLSFGYESLKGVGFNFVYAFCLNDVFGDYQFSDFIEFEL